MIAAAWASAALNAGVPFTLPAKHAQTAAAASLRSFSTWSNSFLFLPPPFMKAPSAASAFFVASAPAASQAGIDGTGVASFSLTMKTRPPCQRDENPIRRAGD